MGLGGADHGHQLVQLPAELKGQTLFAFSGICLLLVPAGPFPQLAGEQLLEMRRISTFQTKREMHWMFLVTLMNALSEIRMSSTKSAISVSLAKSRRGIGNVKNILS